MNVAPIAPTWAVVALAVLGIGALLHAVLRRHRAWAVRGLLALVLAAAGINPVIGTASVATGSSDVDVLFVVDTTASSAAEDLAGDRTRLDGMQADMRALVARYRGARFSMVTFDRTARYVLPRTDDAEATVAAIDGLLPELAVYSGGSRTDEAVDTLDDALADGRGDDTLLVYLGDGEDVGGRSDGARFATLRDHVRGGAVLGYGTRAGGPMRETTTSSATPGDYLRDADGDRVRSRADEAALRDVADRLDVPYTHRTGDDGAAAPAVRDRGGAGIGFGGLRTSTEVDRGAYWVLGVVAAALLLVELAGLVRPVRDAPHLPGRRP